MPPFSCGSFCCLLLCFICSGRDEAGVVRVKARIAVLTYQVQSHAARLNHRPHSLKRFCVCCPSSCLLGSIHHRASWWHTRYRLVPTRYEEHLQIDQSCLTKLQHQPAAAAVSPPTVVRSEPDEPRLIFIRPCAKRTFCVPSCCLLHLLFEAPERRLWSSDQL